MLFSFFSESEKHNSTKEINHPSCPICHESTETDDLIQHFQTKCLYRMVSCKYCDDQEIISSEYSDHLTQHLKDSKQRLALLQEVYEKEMEWFDKIAVTLQSLIA